MHNPQVHLPETMGLEPWHKCVGVADLSFHQAGKGLATLATIRSRFQMKVGTISSGRCPCSWQEGWKLELDDLEGPFQPNRFYESLIDWERA